MGRPKKYSTDEEHREAKKLRYQLRKDEINARRRQQAVKNREKLNAQARAWRAQNKRKALVISNEERINVSDMTSETDFIKTEMDKEVSNPYYDDYVQFLRTHDMNEEDNVKQSLLLARKYINDHNSKHGFQFEKVIQKLMLNKFQDIGIKVYRQVVIENPDELGRGCRIDFVVSEEDTIKDKLDLSKAVIVSCKTTFSTQWREDTHLYDKCKAYIMITLKGKIPHEQLPDNVFFCKPDSDFGEHVIDMDYFTDFIIQKLTDHI